ncbi:MAG: zinc ribbon domain-containing protein [Chloroflexia bacterium]
MWLDILAVVIVVALAALGVWRGLVREVLVFLAGIVPGVFLGDFWVNSWGQGRSRDIQGLIRLGSLLFMVFLIGYGSAVFLHRPKKLPWWQHLTGGLVGLLNGIFLVTFGYSYLRDLGGGAETALKEARLFTLVQQWLPWAFLVIVVAIALAVVVILLVRLANYISRLAVPEGVPAVPSGPPPAVASSPPELPTTPCPNCGRPVPAGASYCPHCGKIISG